MLAGCAPFLLVVCLCGSRVDAFRTLPVHIPTMSSSSSVSARSPLLDTAISRRALGQLAFGAAAALHAPRAASAEFPKIGSLTQQDIDGWVQFDDGSGLRLSDVSAGLGAKTKDGDRLRLRYTVYLLDGTIVSRGAGVEQEFVLGQKQVPAGLENGCRDMKAGAERILYIPPKIGWVGDYRAAALQQIKSCGGTTCVLDEQPVIVFAKLEGYKKAECVGGDTPMSVNADLAAGKLSVTIGSSTCPEGNLEVTEKRLKTMDMLNKMKEKGVLKAEEKQKFVIP